MRLSYLPWNIGLSYARDIKVVKTQRLRRQLDFKKETDYFQLILDELGINASQLMASCFCARRI